MCERLRQTDKQKDRETDSNFFKGKSIRKCYLQNVGHFFSGLMPQSHPTTGPARFLPPVRFLPVRPSDTSVGILRQCCSRGHIRLRPRTAWHGCTLIMVWLNDSQDSTGTPCDVRAGTVRAPQGNLQCFSYRTGSVRGGKMRTAPHGARAGPVSGRTIFVQNSPGTARTEPGSVMWLGHQYRLIWCLFFIKVYSRFWPKLGVSRL